jgi:peptidoglycan hydrolase CwlO-like protein
MAKNKIERIDGEIQKTREKITEQQEKLKALEAQKTEAENLEIVQMVRALRMTPEQLSAMLSSGSIPGRDQGSADNTEQEDTAHEE